MDLHLVPEPPPEADVVGLPVTSPALADGHVGRPPGGWLEGFADVDGFAAASGFTGGVGETLAWPAIGESPNLTLFGVGASSTVDGQTARRAGAALARATARHRRVAAVLPSGEPAVVQAFAEGFVLASYRFTAYRSEITPGTERLDLVHASDRLAAAVTRAGHVARAVCLARDLGNEPGGTLTPVELADRAAVLAAASGLTCEVWDERRIADERLGGLLGVARGSTLPPRLVIVRHEAPRDSPSVALVGKGVTFDAGGLSIKPNAQMLTMKADMAGAAAVLAAMTVLPALDCPVRVTGYLPLTDNMLGGDATRIGDVLRVRDGTTVEVRNADAEGRLILADALALAAEATPDAIIDVATLTAAVSLAVGRRYAGLAGNDTRLVAHLSAAAARAGERVWELPLADADPRELRSGIADVVNVNGRPNGQSTLAALFLSRFVPATIPWAHLDINGPAFSDEDDGELTQGATGYGVRTLLEILARDEAVVA